MGHPLQRLRFKTCFYTHLKEVTSIREDFILNHTTQQPEVIFSTSFQNA